MSIINDALKKANEKRNPADASSRIIKLFSLIIILAGLVTYSFFISHRKSKEKAAQLPVASAHQTRLPDNRQASDKHISSNAESMPAAESKQDEVIQETANETVPLLNLTGIIKGEGKLFAVINNAIVEEGQTIEGMKVKKIYTDRVVLGNDEKEFTVMLN